MFSHQNRSPEPLGGATETRTKKCIGTHLSTYTHKFSTRQQRHRWRHKHQSRHVRTDTHTKTRDTQIHQHKHTRTRHSLARDEGKLSRSGSEHRSGVRKMFGARMLRPLFGAERCLNSCGNRVFISLWWRRRPCFRSVATCSPDTFRQRSDLNKSL